MRIHPHIPEDRLLALSRGETLPDRTYGAALFADISGFTPLTEALCRFYGNRRGAEELTIHINAVYASLIDVLESYDGSVIDFAGDSILCWFDEQYGDPASRAVACALLLQEKIRSFSSITVPDGLVFPVALKVSVATGPARRFSVGDPTLRRLDTLAGATVARTAVGEKLASRGDVLVDQHTADILGDELIISDWRGDHASSERYAVVTDFKRTIPQKQLSQNPPDVPESLMKEWLHRKVYEREATGQGSFLTEFRPCVAMFVRFIGIDFDSDQARAQLDGFVCRAQAIVSHYDGTLVQITIGDKGSYLYINIGALGAHEDDARRGLKIAMELRTMAAHRGYLQPLQIGLTHGILRTGVYGSPNRHTYGALGDDVNLAARLMQYAEPGEIIVSGRVKKAAADYFSFEARSELVLKGRSEPLTAYLLVGEYKQRPMRLQEPNYALPMIGRQDELVLATDRLKQALAGHGQVIGIVAEAGMGKSRLVAEIIRQARQLGFVGYGGSCHSSGTNMPYMVWRSIWFAFFDIQSDLPETQQVEALRTKIELLASARMDAFPLLGSLLNLDIDDNDFTRTLDPKDRRLALDALLEVCLRAASMETPHLIVLEDLHWIDPISNELLELLARISVKMPVCFVLAYRTPDGLRYQAPLIENLFSFTRISLTELSKAESETLIRAKLQQLFPDLSVTLPKSIVRELISKAQGNPFYIEELLNYLHGRGLDPQNASMIDVLKLPSSLHALILSRIDQLTEIQKVTLRVASVIGRVFMASWLLGFYPALGDEDVLKSNLAMLSVVDLTPLDTPEPELAYIFKHIITQEVAYESLAFATRAQLHEALARYLEETYLTTVAVDILAFHYGHSNNLPKKREYLTRAGKAAQAAYSNAAALDYYQRVLETAPPVDDYVALQLDSGVILQFIGRPDEAYQRFQQALDVAERHQLESRRLECEIKLAFWCNQRGEYAQALEWLSRVRERTAATNDINNLCDALLETGVAYWRQADFETAKKYLTEGLELAQAHGDRFREVPFLTVMGQGYGQVNDLAESRQYYARALKIARELNDKRRIAGVLTNYSIGFYYEGNYVRARELLEEALAVTHEIGDKRLIGILLNNLGGIFYLENDLDTARSYYEKSLELGNEADDNYVRSLVYNSLGITLFRLGNLEAATAYCKDGLALNQSMGDKIGMSLSYCYLGIFALARHDLDAARAAFASGLDLAYHNDIKYYLLYNLIGMAAYAVEAGRLEPAVRLLAVSPMIFDTIGIKPEPEIQEPYDRALARAKELLSPAAFDSAWEAGRTLTVDDAMALAGEL